MKIRLKELLRQICEANEINIISGVVSTDHIHMFVSIVPQVSISKLIMRMKGRTSHLLQQEFADLRKRYWGQHLWARGYFCVSAGHVEDEKIQNYIAGHTQLAGADKIDVESDL